jgi:tripartite-type tricarboxylate transporter receptor subunit TctC
MTPGFAATRDIPLTYALLFQRFLRGDPCRGLRPRREGRAGGKFGADDAASAAFVLDNEWLSETLRKAVGRQPDECVGDSTGTIGNDDFFGVGCPIFRACGVAARHADVYQAASMPARSGTTIQTFPCPCHAHDRLCPENAIDGSVFISGWRVVASPASASDHGDAAPLMGVIVSHAIQGRSQGAIGKAKALTLVIAASLSFLGSARAQAPFPNKPVRIIVDSAPGSAIDVATRLMAQRLTAIWGQQAVIDNRPGAGGSIAVRAGQAATPDGYTLYSGSSSTFTALKGAPGVAPNLPIELPRDFEPIGFINEQPMFFAVAAQLHVNSLPELIALAKNKPGELSYATTGRGRITHLTMELMQERAGIKLQMIPYSGGPAAAMSDLGTGRVSVIVEGYAGLASGLTSGLIRGIAVAAQNRLDDFKDLPTVSETLPGFSAGGWNVLLAPIGTPEAIVRKLSVDLREAMDDALTKNKLAQVGIYFHPMTPEQVMTFTQEQQRIWRPVAERIEKE